MLNDAKCGIHDEFFLSEIAEKYFNKIYEGTKYLIPNCTEWKKQWMISGLRLRMNINHWEVWQTFTLFLHNWEIFQLLQSKLPDCGHSLAKKWFSLSPFHVLPPLFHIFTLKSFTSRQRIEIFYVDSPSSYQILQSPDRKANIWKLII